MAEVSNTGYNVTQKKAPDVVHEYASKPIVLNPDYVPPVVQVRTQGNEKRKYYCTMCGRDYPAQRGNFPVNGKSMLWRANGGYVPVCKTCCETLMDSLITFYSGNEEHAIKHLCATFDWPYDENASVMTLTQAQTGRTRISLYPSKLCTRQVSERVSTYMDTIRDEYAKSQVITSAPQSDEDINDETRGDEFVVTKEMVRNWGKGFTSEEYDFLQNEYADWVSKNICNSKAQEELFRNITLAQLDVRRAREKGGKVSDAQKALQDLMNSANILPRQTADNILADTMTFGLFIKKIEEEEPIPEPSEEWRDVDGIRKYVNTFYTGGLAKALRINNENSALYDEAMQEMERYTVYPPSTSDGDQNDVSIFESTVIKTEDGGEGI